MQPSSEHGRPSEAEHAERGDRRGQKEKWDTTAAGSAVAVGFDADDRTEDQRDERRERSQQKPKEQIGNTNGVQVPCRHAADGSVPHGPCEIAP